MFRTIGIDIGTAFITAAGDTGGLIARKRHHGRIHETLLEILNGVAPSDSIVFTGKAGKDVARLLDGEYIEEAEAYACLLSEEQPFASENGWIIDIGASSLTLYAINGDQIADISENTLCAAGTGLFLEEQARRLNIDMENMGATGVETPPLIASRCTVFAKSDLIHHQQEGRTIIEMWAGLCRSLVVSAVNTLFRGRRMNGEMMLCGGVSLNREVLRWFSLLYPDVRWFIPAYSSWAVALGASGAQGKPKNQLRFDAPAPRKHLQRMPPLTLRRSRYPIMTEPETDDNQNEIRVYRFPENGADIVLGADIGSTSTKMAVLDARTLEPLLDIYGRTSGDPVRACRLILDSFRKIAGELDLTVRAAGTTGSGRYLAGRLLEADYIVNEISAHAQGAVHFFPDVDTIFEIGGQDAKYIRLQDGYPCDVNMNYVCAAGTGSFVEEQARKLGIAVQDIGKMTEHISPPVTSDRCTVFMEQDLAELLKEGFSREEALASVLYSVIRNYLNRVVGARAVSDHIILFQGATARNKGLAAALENLLNVEVRVSPFCHIMGAIGAALAAYRHCREHFGDNYISAFSGLNPAVLDAGVRSRTETCKLCRNFCRINHISRDNGPEFSWGYQCGRDARETSRRELPQFELFKRRETFFYGGKSDDTHEPSFRRGAVAIVNALGNFAMYPLWRRFFHELGIQTVLSGYTGPAIKTLAASAAPADFCFPAKIVLGHVLKAADRHLPIFMPHLIAQRSILETTNSYFCPYMQAAPSFVRSTLRRSGRPFELLTPVIDLRRSFKHIAIQLYDSLKSSFDIKRKDVLRALHRAFADWRDATRNLEAMGGQWLNNLSARPEPFFVLVGRSYNIHDAGLNLGIPEKLASMGFPVIPLDMLDLDDEIRKLSKSNYHNLFWNYGQRIIAVIRAIRRIPNAFPVYLSNFNCGPDSFLLGYAEEEMKGKPMLVLELDELDSDGGYLTRMEAFLDVARSWLKEQRRNAAASMEPRAQRHLPHIFTGDRPPEFTEKAVVWMSPIHPCVGDLFSAAFRAFGYDCRLMPPEDDETLTIGKKYLRGGECLPMTLTLGGFIREALKERDKQHILFMPTTDGPCRFGQYNLMDRIVLNDLGVENTDMISPSSMNSYAGLDEDLRRHMMHAVMASDILFKLVCKVRPYEREKGASDALFAEGLQQLARVLEQRGDVRKTIRQLAARFSAIDVLPVKKPLVGVVGEIYVRCNPFSNGDLVRVIEENGGEAWLTPMHEWLLYVAHLKRRLGGKNKKINLLGAGEALLTWMFFHKTEQSYYDAAGRILSDRREPPIQEVVAAGENYLPLEFQGEAILTVGRADIFARDGADLVINAAPFGCMPGTIAGSLLLETKEIRGVPIVSSFYDGDLHVNGKIASLLRTLTRSPLRTQKETIQYNSNFTKRTSKFEL